MTKLRRAACSTFVLLTVSAPASAQPAPQRSATLRATGTFASNGTFAGTVTVNRFEQRGTQIVAIGVVQGTLSRANRVIGTGLAGEIAFPVRLSAGGVQLATGHSSNPPGITPARWSEELILRRTVLEVGNWKLGVDSSNFQLPTSAFQLTSPNSQLRTFGLRRAQAQGCTPLQVNIDGTTVDLMGTLVTLDPVGLTLVGVAGTPLGDLVCAASDLIGNVAAIVNLLNSLLGVLTGLLGGLTGGLTGIAGA
jgi:hypothetical protein